MDIQRRLFLKLMAATAGLLPCTAVSRVFAAPPSPKPDAHQTSALVIIAQRPGAVRSDGTLDTTILASMVSSSLCRLTGASVISEAWRSLFKPSEIIGIKVNAVGGPGICTHPLLVSLIARQLADAGIPEHHIVIWDRLSNELERGGYTIQRSGSGIRCFGTDNDYETNIETAGSIGSCFSRIIASCDALINIPVLKDHDLSGVSLGLKNFYGAIHNPNKYHDNHCDPFIADLNTHPYIKNKHRLTIIDGLRAQYNGGPSCKQQWQWHYAGLILSRDPVAADAIGTAIIEKKRQEQGLPSLADSDRPPLHIRTAAQRGLGTDNTNAISQVQV